MDKDYRGFEELHNVWYDPALIGVAEMEKELKEAGLYLGTVE